jgi:hypothetical protein
LFTGSFATGVIAGDFFIEFASEILKFRASTTERFGFVAEHALGGPLNAFAQLTNPFTRTRRLLAGVFRQALPHAALRRLQRPLDVPIL